MLMSKSLMASIAAGLALAVFSLPAAATPESTTSPNGALPSGVTAVGGIVLDLQGSSGRVVSQLAASSLFIGFSNNGTPGSYQGNPLTIGIQNGFDSATLSALGGSITSASVRITLWDGDSAPGDFDFHSDTLFLNGISFGDFSDVSTQETDGTGMTLISSGTGFGDEILSTGFFTTTDSAALTALFASLSGGTVSYTLFDNSPTDNFFDFTQGLDGGLIDVGTGPVVVPPTSEVPEPLTLSLFGMGLVGAAALRRRKHKA